MLDTKYKVWLKKIWLISKISKKKLSWKIKRLYQSFFLGDIHGRYHEQKSNPLQNNTAVDNGIKVALGSTIMPADVQAAKSDNRAVIAAPSPR